MILKLLLIGVGLVAAFLVLSALPDVARYLRMRAM
jgi:hypothetical protein